MNQPRPDMTAEQYTEILVAELMKTDDFKRVTRSFVHEMLTNWAGESGLKKWMAPSLEKRMQKSLLGPEAQPAAEETAPATEAADLTAPLIALVNDLLDRVEQLAKILDGLDPDKAEALAEVVVSGVRFEKMAALAGPLARALTRIREKRPTFLTDLLRERLTAGVEGLDFNTATAFLAAAGTDLAAVSRIINQALWQSPDRLAEALTVLPAAVNLLTRVAAEYLQRFSKLKIQEITDIFLQLLDRIDGESLGALINAWAQINRKVIRGARQLLDPAMDIPSSENVLLRKVEEIGSHVDPDLIFNLRLGLEDMKGPLREWMKAD
ncbi:MAG: hypothetical protein AB1724_13435 [Thermodesulfobacteriota bacterium]